MAAASRVLCDQVGSTAPAFLAILITRALIRAGSVPVPTMAWKANRTRIRPGRRSIYQAPA